MPERKFFNSVESQILEAEKNRQRKRQKKLEERQRILDSCQAEIERVSIASSLAKHFASRVDFTLKPKQSEQSEKSELDELQKRQSELSKLTESLAEKASIHRFSKGDK